MYEFFGHSSDFPLLVTPMCDAILYYGGEHVPSYPFVIAL